MKLIFTTRWSGEVQLHGQTKLELTVVKDEAELVDDKNQPTHLFLTVDEARLVRDGLTKMISKLKFTTIPDPMEQE